MANYEPALRRLDRWYYNRMDRNMTSDATKHIALRAAFELINDGFGEYVGPQLMGSLTRDTLLNEAAAFWTSRYSLVEQIQSGVGKEGRMISNVPLSRKQEYIDPYLENFEKLKGFVDKVRQKPEWTDREIDDIFLSHFQGLEGYLIFNQRSLELAGQFMYGVDPELTREHIPDLKVIETLGKVLPLCIRTAFKDLKVDSRVM